MNIRYANGRFEAEFSSDFNGDLAAVKAAGFKPDTSTGSWIWHTSKIPVIEKLRANRPPSGVTANPDALETYKRLAEMEAKNAEIRKAAKAFEKQQKKERKEVAQPEDDEFNIFDAQGDIVPSSLPPMPKSASAFKPPQPPAERCKSCGDPLYVYESKDLCLWCEKELDNVFEL